MSPAFFQWHTHWNWLRYIYIYIYIYIEIEREREKERKTDGQTDRQTSTHTLQYTFKYTLTYTLSLSHTHTHTHTYIYVCVYIYKLETVEQGDLKGFFSIATTSKCRGGRYSFPGITPICPRYVFLSFKQVPFLKSSVWCDLGLNPGLPDHWRTLYPHEPVCVCKDTEKERSSYLFFKKPNIS